MNRQFFIFSYLLLGMSCDTVEEPRHGRSSCIVPRKHDRIDFFSDVVVAQIGAILRSFDEQIQKC